LAKTINLLTSLYMLILHADIYVNSQQTTHIVQCLNSCMYGVIYIMLCHKLCDTFETIKTAV